jgi:hypothetical protein
MPASLASSRTRGELSATGMVKCWQQEATTQQGSTSRIFRA